jgi:hypothetical protein
LTIAALCVKTTDPLAALTWAYIESRSRCSRPASNRSSFPCSWRAPTTSSTPTSTPLPSLTTPSAASRREAHYGCPPAVRGASTNGGKRTTILEKKEKRIHRIHVYSSPCARPHTRLAGSTTPRLACSTKSTYAVGPHTDNHAAIAMQISGAPKHPTPEQLKTAQPQGEWRPTWTLTAGFAYDLVRVRVVFIPTARTVDRCAQHVNTV